LRTLFRVEIQHELVRRARADGVTTKEIVRILVAGVGTKRLSRADREGVVRFLFVVTAMMKS
jgi:hypothetical protein